MRLEAGLVLNRELSMVVSILIYADHFDKLCPRGHGKGYERE